MISTREAFVERIDLPMLARFCELTPVQLREALRRHEARS